MGRAIESTTMMRQRTSEAKTSADGDIAMKDLIGAETGRAHVNGANIVHAVPTHELGHDQ